MRGSLVISPEFTEAFLDTNMAKRRNSKHSLASCGIFTNQLFSPGSGMMMPGVSTSPPVGRTQLTRLHHFSLARAKRADEDGAPRRTLSKRTSARRASVDSSSRSEAGGSADVAEAGEGSSQSSSVEVVGKFTAELLESQVD